MRDTWRFSQPKIFLFFLCSFKVLANRKFLNSWILKNLIRGFCCIFHSISFTFPVHLWIFFYVLDCMGVRGWGDCSPERSIFTTGDHWLWCSWLYLEFRDSLAHICVNKSGDIVLPSIKNPWICFFVLVPYSQQPHCYWGWKRALTGIQLPKTSTIPFLQSLLIRSWNKWSYSNLPKLRVIKLRTIFWMGPLLWHCSTTTEQL